MTTENTDTSLDTLSLPLASLPLPRLRDYVTFAEPIPADGDDWLPVHGDRGEDYALMPSRIEVQES